MGLAVDRRRKGGRLDRDRPLGDRARPGSPAHGLAQGDREHLRHVRDEAELEALAEQLRDLLEVLAVRLREDDRVDLSPPRGQDLLFHAADRQDVAAQGDLTGHGNRSLDGLVGQNRDDGGRYRDARRRAYLGDRSVRHVDMDVQVTEGVEGDADVGRPGTGVGQRRLGRLLHDGAQVSCQDQPPLPWHDGRLHEQDLAARRGPGEPGGHAHLIVDQGHLGGDARNTEQLLRPNGRDLERPGFALGHAARQLAAGLGDLALQVPETRLTRVLLDDRLDRLVGERHLGLAQAVLLDLLRDQVPPGDLDLLLLGVAGQADDLHPVAERRLDRVEQVRRGHEHHVRQIERHVQVMVAERVILLRVQDLEQGRGRVAPVVGADLVDLVEHEHRVVRGGLGDALDDASRHRADIGAAVAADLRLVPGGARRALSRNCSTSSARSLPSPSSFWIALSCCRRKYSRWDLSISSRACELISCCMFRSSISLFSRSLTRFRRATGSMIFRTACASSILRSRLLATRSASRPGSSRLLAMTITSEEIALPSEALFSSDFLTVRIIASCSIAGLTAGSTMRVRRAVVNDSPRTNSSTPARQTPCISTRMRPSGSFSIRMMTPTVPTLNRSFSFGSSTWLSFWDTRRIIRFSARAWSTALIERSRLTDSGTMMNG